MLSWSISLFGILGIDVDLCSLYLYWATLSGPHTSKTALQDTYVCMYVLTDQLCGHIPKILTERIDLKFAHMLKCTKVFKPSLSSSILINLLNVTAEHDRQGQAAHRTMKSRSLQVKAIHNDTHKRQRLSS